MIGREFVVRTTKCWRCGALIQVYTWKDHELWPQSCPEKGRPASVQWQKSEVVEGGYWANTCSRCGVIQGDWHLYCEPDGVFCSAGVIE